MDKRVIVGVLLAALAFAATAATPSKASRCAACRGIGSVPCRHCILFGRMTGKQRCSECAATGRITCPTCMGTWQRSCTRCAGKGKVYTGETSGMFKHKTYKTCHQCAGSGQQYCTWNVPSDAGTKPVKARSCPQCSGARFESLRGTIPCPTCKGTRASGICPACHGSKKVTCPKCQGKAKPNPGPPTTAPSIDWHFKSATATAAKVEYDKQVKQAYADLNNALRRVRADLVRQLDIALNDATRAGDLDDALKIRAAKRAMASR